MVESKSKRKQYTKANCLYIGDLFDEMDNDEVLNDLKCKVIYNSSSLQKALYQSPKIAVLRTFGDQSKNNQIVQTVVSQSPNTKILVIGAEKDDFKKTLSREVDLYIPEDSNFEDFKTSIEKLQFAHKYGEMLDSEEIDVHVKSDSISTVFWGFVGLFLVASVILAAVTI
jgi:DNA-binding NarL/FixJ family response regulator